MNLVKKDYGNIIWVADGVIDRLCNTICNYILVHLIAGIMGQNSVLRLPQEFAIKNYEWFLLFDVGESIQVNRIETPDNRTVVSPLN